MNGKMLMYFVLALLMAGTRAGNVRGEEEKSKPDERLLFSFTLGNQDGYILKDQTPYAWQGRDVPYPDGRPGAKRVPAFGAKALEWIDPYHPGIEFAAAKEISPGYSNGIAVEFWVRLRRYLEDYPPPQEGEMKYCSDLVSAGSPFFFRIANSGRFIGYFRLTPADPAAEPWGGIANSELGPEKAIPLNKWTHVAYSYDAESHYAFLFINGRQVAENNMEKVVSNGKSYFKDYRVNLGPAGGAPLQKIKIGVNLIGSVDGIKVWLYPKRDFMEEVKRCEKYLIPEAE